MFEQTFKNIDDILHKDAGCTSELDYTEQSSWLLFLKYLDALEQDKATEAALEGKPYAFILDKPYRWGTWAAPKGKDGKLDHNAALTGDDLRDFVNQKLFPYFTIYDFVQAHHHFNDPEWDGEPEELDTEGREGSNRIVQRAEPDPKSKDDEPEKKQKTLIKLADGKERTIQHMMSTTFWSADGRPMSATQFLENMFGALPEFFKNEAELRTIWSKPDTRKALLAGLSDKGYGRDTMTEMQRIIEAENSDLFDVLAYVAFALHPQTREARADKAKVLIHDSYSDKQRAFLEFVLAQYVKQGVDELDQEKLSPLLKLKYNNAISDAVADLGSVDQIRDAFTGFQKYLYETAV